jgi:hypothetical protein
MERGVRVNAEYLAGYPEEAEGGTEEERAAMPTGRAGTVDYGPCLYLGPSGQRCSHRALQGGFCALHKPGAEQPAVSKPNAKRAAAVAAAIAALLPFLGDLIRALIRLLK